MRLIIVILNINFNKIYLTKKFSILKLINKSDIDVGKLLELTNKLNSLDDEYNKKTDFFNSGEKQLEDINITYATLSNANIILQNEIKTATMRLNTVQNIENMINKNANSEKSFLLYQTLLFKQYIFFNLYYQLIKYKNAKDSLKIYQRLLFNQYSFFLLTNEIEKFKKSK